MSLTEEQQKEIRKLCFLWISRHDSLKLLKADGMQRRAVREQEERLIEASRISRDAITGAGI